MAADGPETSIAEAALRLGPRAAAGRRGAGPGGCGASRRVDWSPRAAAARRPWQDQVLPIHKVLPDFLEALRTSDALVLQAPTGAGKTTVAPLALLESGLVEGRILVLQPRRITALRVAKRMAELMGERVGQAVGYRIRHDRMVGNATRVEVVTEGVLVRMLHENPSLEGIGCIFFDEFHERGAESDVSFALCLAAQRRSLVRPKLVVMSATFGTLAERVAFVMGEAPRLISEGRAHPVDINYCGVLDLKDYEPDGPAEFANNVAAVVVEALQRHGEGDALVFLPGEREIMYTWIALNNLGYGDGKRPANLVGWAHRLIDERAVDLSRKVTVSPLYGTLDMAEQAEALEPPTDGWRKVILATNIAESSLTVPRVKIVVDSGLRRLQSTDAEACLSRSLTVPVSTASADQRAGRAGRVSRGVCYRLWSERQHAELPANDETELERGDLTGVVLDLAVAGYTRSEDVAALPWLDAPSEEGLDKARRVLARIRALEREDGAWRLTERGRRMAALPLHPRLGHMILQAKAVSDSFARDACDLAALLEEKELLRGGRNAFGADLGVRLDALQRPEGHQHVYHGTRERVVRASAQLQNLAGIQHIIAARTHEDAERKALSALLAWAYPELLATVDRGTLSIRNGAAAKLHSTDPLRSSRCLAIATITGDKIFWAMDADPSILAKYGIDVLEPEGHTVLGIDEACLEGPSTSEAEVGGGSRAAGSARAVMALRRAFAGVPGFENFETVQDFVEAAAARPGALSDQSLVALLWDFVRASPRQELAAQALLKGLVARRAPALSADQLCQVACAIACCESIAMPDVMQQVVEALAPCLGALPLDGEHGSLSALLWALAATRTRHKAVAEAAAHRAVEALVAYQPRVLSDVREVCFWVFLRESSSTWSSTSKFELMAVRFADQPFYEALGSKVQHRLSEIHPITCVYLMWSFAKANVSAPALFDAVALRVVPAVRQLDRCGLTMFCWNFAFSGLDRDDVYECVAADAVRAERLAELAPRDVAGLAWAFVRAGRGRDGASARLLEALVQHAAGLLQDGIWQKCYRGPNKSLYRPVYEGDHSAEDSMVDAFDCLTLADLLDACATLGIRDQKLLTLAVDYATLGLKEAGTARVSKLFIKQTGALARALRRLAELGAGSGGAQLDLERLFAAAAPHVAECVMQPRPEHLLNFVVACSLVPAAIDAQMVSALDRALGSAGGAGGRWSSEDRAALDRAAAALGLQAEFRGQAGARPPEASAMAL